MSSVVVTGPAFTDGPNWSNRTAPGTPRVVLPHIVDHEFALALDLPEGTVLVYRQIGHDAYRHVVLRAPVDETQAASRTAGDEQEPSSMWIQHSFRYGAQVIAVARRTAAGLSVPWLIYDDGARLHLSSETEVPPSDPREFPPYGCDDPGCVPLAPSPGPDCEYIGSSWQNDPWFPGQCLKDYFACPSGIQGQSACCDGVSVGGRPPCGQYYVGTPHKLEGIDGDQP